MAAKRHSSTGDHGGLDSAAKQAKTPSSLAALAVRHVDPNRFDASPSTSWFGQVILRSSDGGQTWDAAGKPFAYDSVSGGNRSHPDAVR